MQTDLIKSIAESQPEEGGQLESLEMVKTGVLPRIIGAVLLILWAVAVTTMMFAPWRQSVVGSGEIIVFSPMDRPQTIEAQIPGRLVRWYVRDGQNVQKGQLIADLMDLDPRYLDNTQLKSMVDQKQELIAKRDASKQKFASLKSQSDDLGKSRQAAVPAAEERVAQAHDRLYAAQQSVDAAEQSVKTSQWQLDRIASLYAKGLRSQRDQQVAQLDNVKATTELQRAKSAYDVVKRDAGIAGLEYQRVSADTQASINAIKAAAADANQLVASTAAEIDKLDIDIQNLAQRIQQRAVRAPTAGRVVRLNRVGAGETVSAGNVLATIVPLTEDRAAAIMIRDYDAPLCSVGNPVRLSISGWPALQFVGWPSVAVGTFAGRISVIDAVDDGRHFFRAIVVPDHKAIEAKKEQPWPSPKFLRPGATATGWVLLGNVPLWYEIWRQFNGFQPTVPPPEGDGTTGHNEGHSEQQ